MNRLLLATTILLACLPAHPAAAADKSRRTHPAIPGRQTAAEKAAARAPHNPFVPLPRRSPPISQIIGGGNATTGAYPWMIALVEAGNADLYDAQFCGATLIHPSWVVTAAHCVESHRPGELDVVVGIEDLNNPTNSERISVAEIITHPDYNPYNSDADIALLRLEHPAAVPHQSALALLDTAALESPGTNARILGWGTTSATTPTYPSRLQQADLPLVDFATANVIYQGTLTSRMLAAGPPNGSVDSCYGDSGGPLAVFEPTLQRWLLAGVVSFGNTCAQPGEYGIYTRILSFRRFILQHISPGYLAWETSAAVAGRFRDPDADGRTNAAEFLAARNPAVPDPPAHVAATIAEVAGTPYGAIAWTLPAYRPELVSTADFANTPAGPWQTLDLTSQTVGNSPAGAVETLTVRASHPLATPPGRGFFRATAGFATTYSPATRPFSLQSRVRGTITTADPPHPLHPATRAHVYQWQPATGETGTTVRLFARSGEFDTRLELLDHAGTLLESSAHDDAAGLRGGDEEITVTPAAGATYLLRVSPESNGSVGVYSLGGFVAATFNTLPTIASGANFQLTLTNSDPADPLFQPGPAFHHRDYRISPAASGWLRVNMNSSKLDPFINVVDAETAKSTGWHDDDGSGTTNARLDFRLTAGHHYRVRLTTAEPATTGASTVTASTPAAILTIAPGTTVNPSLNSADGRDPANPGAYKEDLLLSPLVPGTTITVDLSAATFDTYLYRLDPVTGETLQENDDRDSTTTNSRLTFTAREPAAILRASSYDPAETGTFTIRATTP